MFFFHLATLMLFASVYAQNDVLDKFIKFVEDYKRPYRNKTEEFQRRFEIFKQNVHRAEVLNKPYIKDSSSVYGITKFADLSQEEFKAQYLSDLRPTGKWLSNCTFSHCKTNAGKIMDYPKKVDWRLHNAVSPVKDQGRCGACWAFAVGETIESMFAISHNTSVPELAIQQLIDCVSSNLGCEGGDTCIALTWAEKNGLTYEKYYPLTDTTESCKKIPPSAERVNVSDFSCSRYVGDENPIVNILATMGPVAVAVDASTWNNYIGGIIQFHCESNINHAVQIVGYDYTGDVPYYIVRNSWGTNFGMDGYLYIKIGGNLCGIAERVSDVTVTVP